MRDTKKLNRVLRLIVLLVCILLFGLNAQTFAQTNAPNIIVILVDDQGWGATSLKMDDHIPASASDFFQMPNLERLGKRGVIFSNGYAPHPNCSPSRASLLTGKSPAQLHLTDIIERHTGPLYEGNFLIPPEHIDQLPGEESTIAEWIKDHRSEYETAHFGKWHLGNGGPEKHGFDASDGPTSNAEGAGNPPEDPKQIFGITKRGMDWMEKQVQDGIPFYLQLSHYAVHLPMESSPSTLEEVSTWSEGSRHTHETFAGMTKDLDQGIGMLLDKVRQLGIEDNTFIVYTSDNGTYPTTNPGNVNGPLHGWKASLWEGGIRVPFMVAGPGIEAGRNDKRIVGYDIFPTICSWLGIDELPEGVEGGSLIDLLDGTNDGIVRPRDYLVFHFPHYQLQKASHPATAIYKEHYKLLKFYETEDLLLYDLDNDLSESKDIKTIHPEIVAEMCQSLEKYLGEIDAGLPTRNIDYSLENDPGRNYKQRKLRLMKEPYFIIK
jgi:arylsulfatase A